MHSEQTLPIDGHGPFFSCSPVISLGLVERTSSPVPWRGEYFAGIANAKIQLFLAKQSQPHWCWAACVQTVLNYHGMLVVQQEIVQRIFGRLTDQPGTLGDIFEALSGFGPVYGGMAMIDARPVDHSRHGAQSILDDLASEHPIVVGLTNAGGSSGHAYVLTAVTFDLTSWGEPIYRSVFLQDPWPFSPKTKEMSWEEFSSRVSGFARVRVIRCA